jgi:hypothetical protein
MANRHIVHQTAQMRCPIREKRVASGPLLGRAASLLVGVAITLAATATAGHTACSATLAVTATRMADLRAPASGRLWFATISVDAAGCAADATGNFDVVVSRAKENAPEVVFRERFVWQAPSVTIAIDFAADEAVEDYRIERVRPCACSG